jgi:T5SS/PEP-CTERM-associated repeat protein
MMKLKRLSNAFITLLCGRVMLLFISCNYLNSPQIGYCVEGLHGGIPQEDNQATTNIVYIVGKNADPSFIGPGGSGTVISTPLSYIAPGTAVLTAAHVITGDVPGGPIFHTVVHNGVRYQALGVYNPDWWDGTSGSLCNDAYDFGVFLTAEPIQEVTPASIATAPDFAAAALQSKKVKFAGASHLSIAPQKSLWGVTRVSNVLTNKTFGHPLTMMFLETKRPAYPFSAGAQSGDSGGPVFLDFGESGAGVKKVFGINQSATRSGYSWDLDGQMYAVRTDTNSGWMQGNFIRTYQGTEAVVSWPNAFPQTDNGNVVYLNQPLLTVNSYFNTLHATGLGGLVNNSELNFINDHLHIEAWPGTGSSLNSPPPSQRFLMFNCVRWGVLNGPTGRINVPDGGTIRTISMDNDRGTITLSGHYCSGCEGLYGDGTNDAVLEVDGPMRNAGVIVFNAYSAIEIVGGDFRHNYGGFLLGSPNIVLLPDAQGRKGKAYWGGHLFGGELLGSPSNAAEPPFPPPPPPSYTPGTVQISGSIVVEERASYAWMINDFNGTAGNADNGWTSFHVDGSLSLSATSDAPFVVQMISIDPTTKQISPAANFNPLNSYSINLITTDEGISGFSSAAIFLDRSQFQNPFSGGKLAVSQQGNNLVLTFTPVTAFPNQFAWGDSSGGIFQTPGKWINNAVPWTSDTAIFDLSSQNGYTVQLAEEQWTKGLVVRNDNLTIDLNSQSYHVYDSSSMSQGTMTVGESFGEAASLEVTGGTLYTGDVYVGKDSGSSGLLAVQGANTVLSSQTIIIGTYGEGVFNVTNMGRVSCSSASLLIVGLNGQGTITVEGQSVLSGYEGDVGSNASGVGHVVVTGEGSQFTMVDRVAIGDYGQGTFTVSDRGYASTSNWCDIGRSVGGNGSLTVMNTGSKWNTTEYMTVGYVGQGSLTIASGGEVVAGTWLAIGYDNMGTGSVNLSGSDSILKVLSSGLTVGRSGSGTLSVENGAQIQSPRGAIAGFPGSIGQATIKGTGSLWSMSNGLYIGKRWDSASGGTGSLVIYEGGTVSVTNLLDLGPQGTVDVSDNGCLIVGSGTSLRLDGTVHVTTNGMLQSVGTITGDVRIDANGLFLVPDGGNSVVNGIITNDAALQVGSSGTGANLSVLGSIIGTGTTTVTNGAELTVDSLVQDTLVIGADSLVAVPLISGGLSDDVMSPVPEPSTLALLLAASLCGLQWWRRRG